MPKATAREWRSWMRREGLRPSWLGAIASTGPRRMRRRRPRPPPQRQPGRASARDGGVPRAHARVRSAPLWLPGPAAPLRWQASGGARWRPGQLRRPGQAGRAGGMRAMAAGQRVRRGGGPAPREVPRRTGRSSGSGRPGSCSAPWPAPGPPPRAGRRASQSRRAAPRRAARTSGSGPGLARRAACRIGARTPCRPASTPRPGRRERVPRSVPAGCSRTFR